MSPSTQALVEKLTPIAERGTDETDADELRYNADNANVLDGTEKPSVVSAALTAALRAAGFKPTDKTVTSLNPAAKRRRVLIWQRA